MFAGNWNRAVAGRVEPAVDTFSASAMEKSQVIVNRIHNRLIADDRERNKSWQKRAQSGHRKMPGIHYNRSTISFGSVGSILRYSLLLIIFSTTLVHAVELAWWRARYNDQACFASIIIDVPDAEIGLYISPAFPSVDESPYQELLGIDSNDPLFFIQFIWSLGPEHAISDVVVVLAEGKEISMVLDSNGSDNSELPNFVVGGPSAMQIWQSIGTGIPVVRFTVDGAHERSAGIHGVGYEEVSAMLQACAQMRAAK